MLPDWIVILLFIALVLSIICLIVNVVYAVVMFISWIIDLVKGRHYW